MKLRIAAWLALMAMVLNGLWPLLAHAAPGGFVAPVCSTVGSPPPGADAPVGNNHGKPGAAHCPFCIFGGDHSPALTAQIHVSAALRPAGQAVAIGRAAEPSFLFLAAAPRGPPVPSI